MKILYLASVRIPSEKAAGLAIVRQCQAFVDIGHVVKLFVPSRDKKLNSSFESVYGITPKFSSVEIKSFSLYSLGWCGFYFMLLFEAVKMFWYIRKKEKNFDLLYSRDQYVLIPFVLSGFASRCYLELHTKKTDFITKFITKRVKKIIVISKGLHEHYADMTGRNDIQVEPSGVDTEQFLNLPTSTELKRKFSLPENSIVFGYVGKYKTMGESKGVEDIIRAFALAYKENTNIHLFIVGAESGEEIEIIELARECDLHDGTYTVLTLDQKYFAEYLMASDVLLMNYPDTEHYAKYMSPTKFFAYLATGKPIISSDLPSIRDVVGYLGILFVRPNDITAFAYAMNETIGEYIKIKNDASKNIDLAKKFQWIHRAQRISGYVWY